METNVVNKQDIKDFLVSLDLAIKSRAEKEEVETRLIPRVYLGQNKEYKENVSSSIYDRPFLTFNLAKRTPASIHNYEFFKAPHVHGPRYIGVREDGVQVFEILRDNQMKLTVRTKSKRESLFLQNFLERVLLFEKDKLLSVVDQFVTIEEEERLQDDLYIFDFVFNCRTRMTIEKIDDIILKEVKFNYTTFICKHFNLETHVCTKVDAEKQDEANDIDCYNYKDFCTSHDPYLEELVFEDDAFEE